MQRVGVRACLLATHSRPQTQRLSFSSNHVRLVRNVSTYSNIMANPVSLKTMDVDFLHPLQSRLVRNEFEIENLYKCTGRNSRKPKKANHGKKPCNRMKRKKKRLRTNSGW
uniref:Uncharacterized protein n=1 Tax=Aplanochytrium stocchinoi TaxID=215587 RepID=A0A7S3LNN1_9STRA|mmetsp:Transcript_9394/g.11696  ORF Transcript_9394/g.11696 Transcript_9394/m.11696 type:complete len:111 (-) Transcript_9394:158-490(-)